jgi:hypothetical protein
MMEPRFAQGLVAAGHLGEQGASMLDVAVALVSAGWPVLPCHPQRKKPLAPDGFRGRSSDPRQTKGWWGNLWPDATVGIVPADGGLVALDVDSAHALTASIGAGLLPPGFVDALKARSPDAILGPAYGLVVATGGTSAPFQFEGATIPPMHVYLRVSGAAPEVEGVVCRYDKGYVIAPGSRGQRLYRLLSRGEPLPFNATSTKAPASSMALVGPPAPALQGAVQTPRAQKPDRAPDLKRVRAAVACIPNTESTDRHAYVAMAHMIKGAAGDDGRDTFLDWAAKWPGKVDPAEDERVFDTITAPRIGWSALWHVAERFGFDSHPERMAEAQDEFDDAVTSPAPPPLPRLSLHARLQAIRATLAEIADVLEREITRAEWLGDLARKTHVPFRSLEQGLAAFDAPHRRIRAQLIRPGPALRDALAQAPPQALVPHYVFVDQHHVLYGTPQSLKTFTALDLGLHIASGLPWLGRIPVQQRGVVFFAGEAASSVRIRIAAWCAARGISVEEAARLPFALLDAVPTLGKGDDGLRDAIDRVQEAAAEFSVPVGLLVLDNMTRLAAVAGLSTTDPGEYGRILAGIDALGRATRAATLTIYHIPVSDKAKSRPAGTYQSTANPDVIMKAERQGSELCAVIRVAPPYGKSRGGPPPADLPLRFKVQDVRAWLTSSYEREGRSLPRTLASAAAEEFSCVDPSSDGSSRATIAASPEAAARESLWQQFTSLVVDGEGTPQTIPTESRNQLAGEGAELERRVLEVLERLPGASGNTLRGALRGTRKTDIDRAVLEVQGTLVEDRRKGNAHAYYLTDAGQAHLRAVRGRDVTDAADTTTVLADLEEGASEEPKRGA